MVDFILLADSSCEPREERKKELQDEKVLPIVGLEQINPRLLDWHSNRQCYRVGSDFRHL